MSNHFTTDGKITRHPNGTMTIRLEPNTQPFRDALALAQKRRDEALGKAIATQRDRSNN